MNSISNSQFLDEHKQKLLGALRYEPGFLLLCDFLQSKLDDLTDDLAQTSDRDLQKLQYWRAFRDFVKTLRMAPEAFAPELQMENPPAQGTPEPEDIHGNNWASIVQQARQYFQDPSQIQ